MPDLTSTYLGLTLRNPLVASSSPLTESVDAIRRLEDAGIGAVVLPSLFEEQLRLESDALQSDLERGVHEFPEATSYLPDLPSYNMGPEGYLELIRKAKQATGIPIIASLNGTTDGGWLNYSRLMEQAGADAIELNLYTVEADVSRSSFDVEYRHVEAVKHVAGAVRVPVAVKLSPYFTAMGHFAVRLARAGARGLVLFNRFYQPDLDPVHLEVVPRLELSRPSELLLRLHWVAILHGKVDVSLAITGGVHGALDVVRSVMAGARATMMASALLANGPEHVRGLLGDLARWLEEHEYQSIGQMTGSMSQNAIPNPTDLERGNYLKVLSSYAPIRP
jgi:dihydroorotate dehydrogenase (fumarate)